MKVSDRLVKIRRYLRDPNARIWSDDFLLNIFNDIQGEIQNRFNLLESAAIIRVPPSYRLTYLYDWEYPHLPTTESGFCQGLKQNQQSEQVYCFEWEMQQTWGITPDVNSEGAQNTHPWEGWYLSPCDVVKIRFPVDFSEAKFIAYNKDPIDYRSREIIQLESSSYITTAGTPYFYYRTDEVDNSFVLYPRPTEANWADGDGMALFSDGDSVDAEVGVYIRRTYSGFDDLTGIDIDAASLDYNVFLIYRVNLVEVAIGDESQFPEYLQKYIDYGVLARAYTANNDGKIKSLADFWAKRYKFGLSAIKKFMIMRLRDRKYRLEATPGARRNRHPRLPSTYPNVNNF